MTITDIGNNMRQKEIRHGVCYLNFQEFYEVLKAAEKIEITDCIIEPYYIDNRIYELYWCELLIDNSIASFEEWVLEKCGKEKMSDIEPEILELRERCFVNDYTQAREKVLKWYDFVIHNEGIREVIHEVFGSFDPSKLFVVIY